MSSSSSSAALWVQMKGEVKLLGGDHPVVGGPWKKGALEEMGLSQPLWMAKGVCEVGQDHPVVGQHLQQDPGP